MFSGDEQPVSFSWLGFGGIVPETTVYKMINIIKASAKNYVVREFAADVTKHVPAKDQWAEAEEIYHFVQNHSRYIKDPHETEMIQSPLIFIDKVKKGQMWYGDCFSADTEVIVYDVEHKRYVVKALIELKTTYNKFMAISYNWNKQKFELKKISNFVTRKNKQTYNVVLKSGRQFSCTDTHKFYFWQGYKKEDKQIIEHALKDIDITNSCMRQMVLAKEIPAINKIKMSNEELYLYGIYAAEGCVENIDNGRVSICQNKQPIVKKIRKALNTLKIKYSEYRTEQRSGGIFRLHKSKWVEKFKVMGTSCFDKHFPDFVYSLSKKQIEKLLEGYFDGDGNIYKNRIMYTTCSKKLVDQLTILHNIIGKPLSIFSFIDKRYKKRRDTNKTICWRLFYYINENGKSNLRKEIQPYLSALSIKSIEKTKIQNVYCLQIEDNHNFVLANGVLTHNCDDFTVLLLSLYRSIGYPTAIRTSAYGKNKKPGHVYGLVKLYGEWFPVDGIKKDGFVGWEAPNATAIKDYEIKNSVLGGL